MRAFAEVFDYYQAPLYNRDALAASVASLIRDVAAGTVLDCACGTGLPAIDLRALGIAVEASDADPGMLEQFRVNATARGVSDKAHQLAWSDLGTLGRQFGLVVCRGNSVAYADSWQRTAPAAPLATIESSVRAIAAAVAPGGCLLIDAPGEREETSAGYPAAVFRGEQVRVSEKVRLAGGCRAWTHQVTIGTKEKHEFTRYSADITGEALRGMLARAGLTAITEVTLEGERPSYQSLLARKPA